MTNIADTHRYIDTTINSISTSETLIVSYQTPAELDTLLRTTHTHIHIYTTCYAHFIC